MYQDKDSQKNLLVAIVLSVAVLLGWQVFYAGPKLKEEQERRGRIHSRSRPRQRPPAGSAERGARRAWHGGAAGRGPRRRPVVAEASRRGCAQGQPARRRRDPEPARVDRAQGRPHRRLVLVKYRETVDPKSPHVVLFSPSGAPHPYYAEYGWAPGGGQTLPMPGPDTVWQAEQGGR